MSSSTCATPLTALLSCALIPSVASRALSTLAGRPSFRAPAGCSSTTGACFIAHWFSKMQRSVTLSSAEAEFFGAMLAAKEVIFIRELLIDLGFIIDAPSVIKCDSKSAVGMAFDPVAFKKTKHILRAAEFLRDLVAREVVSVEHLPGAVMLADILTKAASRAVFVELIKQLDTFA